MNNCKIFFYIYKKIINIRLFHKLFFEVETIFNVKTGCIIKVIKKTKKILIAGYLIFLKLKFKTYFFKNLPVNFKSFFKIIIIFIVFLLKIIDKF